VSNENRDNTTAAAADMESNFSHEPLGQEKITRFTSPVRCHIHSIRKRLADVDGISGKAILDGIVKTGLLKSDTTEQIVEVTYSQEKGETEETIITIETLNN